MIAISGPLGGRHRRRITSGGEPVYQHEPYHGDRDADAVLVGEMPRRPLPQVKANQVIDKLSKPAERM